MVSGTVPSISTPVYPSSVLRRGMQDVGRDLASVSSSQAQSQSLFLLWGCSPDLSGGQWWGRDQRQHQCLPVSLGVSLPASLKCYPAVICNVFQTIYGVHRDESGRVKQQEEDQFISQKYFHKFESEDPIRSLKTVEVEKKKEKERQARNVSDPSK